MNKFEELVAKLEELFELDKADLDFGIHRIIKQKHVQVREYLHKHLPEKVKKVIGEIAQDKSQSKLSEIRRKCIDDLGSDAFDGEELIDIYSNTPLGKQYAKVLRQARETMEQKRNETEIYSHLYEFFSRYYDNADFLSLRRTGRNHKYSVPYNGEEVLLHWANKDQYYIKSSETLNDYTFTLEENNGKLRVKFKLTGMDAVQNNNKAARAFVIDEEKEIEEHDDAIVIPFHFKEFSRKPTEKQMIENLETVLEAKLPGKWKKFLWKEDITFTGKDSRTVLQKHLANYTKKNTSDFFIHKNLGEFLRNELDFYIKNEVMYLDDVDDKSDDYLEKLIRKIKAIRSIAKDLITFLAQFEDFQKKLWLKKKFVIETNYCITLDRIPESLYPEIITNSRQQEEWINLFAIEEIKEEIGQPGYSSPLTLEFLKANPFLVLDTVFFDEDFKYRVLASIDDFDALCDGLLIHSENFQALNMLKEKYNEKVSYIYIDPPYNTASTPILYKNEYKHSSWASLLYDRLNISKQLLLKDGVKTVAIDDTEFINLAKILEEIYSEYRLSRITVIHNPKGSITKDFNRIHEYAIFLTKEDEKNCIARTLEKNKKPRKMRRWGENSLRTERKLSFYPILIKDGKITRIGEIPEDDFHPSGKNVTTPSGEIEIWPIDQNNVERRWNFGLDSIDKNIQRITVQKINDSYDLFLTHEETVPKTVWSGGDYDAGNHGNSLLISILGSKLFDFPKSIKLVKQCIFLVTADQKNSVILDYFAGSGTTGHAVINLNREDNGNRKYILVEMGDYFNTVLKPRITKVIYSDTWKDGKPANRQTGASHCFKYLRLESYEDTLNNLTLEDRQPDLMGLPSDVQEEYLISYMLDIETRDSLLSMEYFENPFDCTLKIYNPETGEAEPRKIDLPETFNYLLGLTVSRIRKQDDFLTIEGKNPAGETVLVIWRNIKEKNNAALEKFVKKTLKINTADTDYKAIYINGDTTLNDPHKKIMLTEEIFHNLMFENESL